MRAEFERWGQAVTGLLAEVWSISRDLFKIMIPILLLVKALELAGFTTYLASLIAPLMAPLGLPAEMGIVWAGTLISNIYTGMVLFVTEPAAAALTGQQVTVLGILMLVAHSLPVELRVAQKIGVSLPLGLVLRLLAAYAAAWLYFQLASRIEPAALPAKTLWEPAIEQQSLLQWVVAQGELLVQIVLIIAALVVLLRLIRVLKLDRVIHFFLRPVLPWLGLTPRAVNITLVGMTLGLTYGGGLLIQESRSGNLGTQELYFTVCLLLLCHGLIEDTLLILLLGADLHGILLFRLLFSFILIAIMVRILRSKDDRFYRRYLLNDNYRASQS